MNFPEVFFGGFLMLALLALGGYFAWRQFGIRQVLAQDRSMPREERGFLIRQTRRRLICSVLMVVLAGMLVGWYFIEAQLHDLKSVADQEPGQSQPLVELLAYYWIAALLVLFGILSLAGLDFFATARFAMHQKKLLDVERRTALEVEATRLRSRRNGS